MESNKIDLQELIEDWAFRIFKQRSDGNQDNLLQQGFITLKTDWKRVVFDHGHPVYEPEPPSPGSVRAITSKIVFATSFDNRTPHQQKCMVRLNRKTHSLCEVILEQSFSHGLESSVTLAVPECIFNANVGLKRNVVLLGNQMQLTEEPIEWSFESRIVCEGHRKVEARLVVTEEEYMGRFVVKTRVSGTVRVLIHDLKENTFLTAIEGDIAEVIGETIRLWEVQGDTVVVDPSGKYVICKTAGQIKLKYGVRQDIEMEQVPPVAGVGVPVYPRTSSTAKV